jgi:hypothetical protein
LERSTSSLENRWETEKCKEAAEPAGRGAATFEKRAGNSSSKKNQPEKEAGVLINQLGKGQPLIRTQLERNSILGNQLEKVQQLFRD